MAKLSSLQAIALSVLATSASNALGQGSVPFQMIVQEARAGAGVTAEPNYDYESDINADAATAAAAAVGIGSVGNQTSSAHIQTPSSYSIVGDANYHSQLIATGGAAYDGAPGPFGLGSNAYVKFKILGSSVFSKTLSCNISFTFSRYADGNAITLNPGTFHATGIGILGIYEDEGYCKINGYLSTLAGTQYVDDTAYSGQYLAQSIVERNDIIEANLIIGNASNQVTDGECDCELTGSFSFWAIENVGGPIDP